MRLISQRQRFNHRQTGLAVGIPDTTSIRSDGRMDAYEYLVGLPLLLRHQQIRVHDSSSSFFIQFIIFIFVLEFETLPVNFNLQQWMRQILTSLRVKITKKLSPFTTSFVLAAVSHPTFKFAWLKGDAEKNRARQKLSARIAMNSFTRTEHQGNLSSANANELFNFEENDSPTKDEIDLYLCDKDKTLSMLDRHPAIKKNFLRYNSALPSSAPVERLFSAAALVLTSRRNRLSDKLLEYLLLLKIYKNL
jgi:hypothetical protein